MMTKRREVGRKRHPIEATGARGAQSLIYVPNAASAFSGSKRINRLSHVWFFPSGQARALQEEA